MNGIPEGSVERKRVLAAMSGGVDSSVTAVLLMESGFSCVGATMRLYDTQAEGGGTGDAADARAVCEKLGIPFQLLDFRQAFRQEVIDRFARCYACGLTPNPCIDCNRHMKFGRLLEAARTLGCDTIATGHYARIRYDEATGRWQLLRALYGEKDQSYVLCRLTQDQLAHTLFPLGGMSKDQVRAAAEARGLVNAHKHDSQDICFVPDGDYGSFLERYTGRTFEPGAFLNEQGEQVGTHRGAPRYTLGQRKGLGLAMGAPVYVTAKDMAANTVTVGPESSLMSRTLTAEDVNLIALPALEGPIRCTAKARYRQPDRPCTAEPLPDGRIRVTFDEPQRALTPGQSLVLYDGEVVLAGAVIAAE